MMIRTKWYMLLMWLICSLGGIAQFKSAVIGVDGLTCSACSFATEKSLLKLEVIDSVHMQLQENTATVFFKPGKKVDMADVSKKITDAGFSVRSLVALVDVGQLTVTSDYCWNYENDVYHFIKITGDSQPGSIKPGLTGDKYVSQSSGTKELKGLVQLKFIGDKFMSPKEFKKWKLYCKNACSPGTTSSPYSKDYYVTIP